MTWSPNGAYFGAPTLRTTRIEHVAFRQVAGELIWPAEAVCPYVGHRVP
jgi:hypothetical protein